MLGVTRKSTVFSMTSVEESFETQQQKDDKALPKAEPGEDLKLLELEPKQNFTQPPPRYTEGSLVKELEENGIGRPSTGTARSRAMIARTAATP